MTGLFEGKREIAHSGDREWPEIDSARDAILLDVDGTILDIAAAPQDVHVPAPLRRSLARLIASTNGATALVSGRTLATLDSLFAPLRIAAIGCHGAEIRRSPHGANQTRVSPLPATLRLALSDIHDLEPRIRIEDKTFALAFHFRGARDREEDLLALLRRRITPFAGEYALLHGKSVFEVRPRTCNKGEALRALMQSSPFTGRRPVFFGDDKTDEDAFAVLPEFAGLGVTVGRRAQNAAFMVHTPHDVRRWLAALAENIDGTTDG